MKEKSSKDQLAERIIQKTEKLCQFGSTNRKDLKDKADKEFKKVLKAIHYVLNYDQYAAIQKKLSQEDKLEVKKLKPKARQIKPQGFDLKMTAKDNQINSGFLSYLSLQDIVGSNILSIIAKLYHTTFEWNTDLLANLHASFALYYRQTCVFANTDLDKINRNDADVLKYEQIEATGVSNYDWEERLFYLQYILRAGRELVAEHGFANCDPLADIALFEAFSLKVPYSITRIAFLTTIISPEGWNVSDTSRECINAIVLGNWPNPGCLIICPWLKNKYFYWQGSFENTPELPKYLNYSHVIFSDYQNLVEREKIYQLLAKNNYSGWENLGQRQTNLQLIKKYVEDFSKALKLANFPIVTLKTTLHAFYNTPSFWATKAEDLVDLIVEYVGDAPTCRGT